jgi:hypothetical protein
MGRTCNRPSMCGMKNAHRLWWGNLKECEISGSHSVEYEV